MGSAEASERDVFISYAHIDNDTLTDDDLGWVTAFDRALRKRLAQVLGRRPEVWRDQKLQGNDVFGDEIVDQFPKLRVLVSVISPRYVESEWCRRELSTFYEAAKEQGDGARVGNKSRIFKVIKTPVPRAEHPEEIRDVLGYEFYEEDEGGRFREFNLEKGSPTYYKFLERFEDIVQDLSELIRMLESDLETESGAPSAAVPREKSKEKTVYLAKTTSDLRGQCDGIRRDLEHRGYEVLPDIELPLDGTLRDSIEQHLDRCSLAVHLIGAKRGLVPEDEERSLVEVQHELSQQADLTRLIWIPPEMTCDDERQNRFLDDLRDHAADQPRTDLLVTHLEEFKTVLIETLEKPAAKAPVAAPSETDGSRRVYLIYDLADRDEVVQVDDFLYDQGLEVLKPVFDGDEAAIRDLHKDSLRVCDAALIYCNRAAESWLGIKMNDLRKAPGFGRDKPLAASAAYLCGEPSRFKERFRSRDAQVIKQFDRFSETDLLPFVDSLASEGDGE